MPNPYSGMVVLNSTSGKYETVLQGRIVDVIKKRHKITTDPKITKNLSKIRETHKKKKIDALRKNLSGTKKPKKKE